MQLRQQQKHVAVGIAAWKTYLEPFDNTQCDCLGRHACVQVDKYKAVAAHEAQAAFRSREKHPGE